MRVAAAAAWVCAACATAQCADPFVQYLAGVEVLEQARGIGDARRAALYRKLCEVTGMSAAEAARRIEALKNNPQQLKKVQSGMLAVLGGSPDTEEE
jgi:hypothetical protein